MPGEDVCEWKQNGREFIFPVVLSSIHIFLDKVDFIDQWVV